MNQETDNNIPLRLKTLSRFKIHEIIKLYRVFFSANMVVGFFALLLYFSSVLTESIGLSNDSFDKYLNSFKQIVNELSYYFWGGKVFLWGAIIYIFLMIVAKGDENWFRNFNLDLKVLILPFPKIIGLSILILAIGFFLGSIPQWASLWIVFFIIFFSTLLPGEQIFKDVYHREFPDKYELFYGYEYKDKE